MKDDPKSFFFCFWRPILLTTHFHAFDNGNQLHHPQLHFFTPSLLYWPAACVTFNGERASNCPYFLLQLFSLDCFHVSCVKWSFNSHVLHPSNRVSFSRLELKIESERARFNASLVIHFAGVPFFVSKFVFLSFFFLSLQSWRRDSILRPWVSRQLLTLKTTVSRSQILYIFTNENYGKKDYS